MAGKKHDQGKPEVGLIPTRAILEEAKAFTFGKKKYGKYNFKNGIEIIRLISASMRHTLAFLAGEDIDPESQVHHLGCARANLAIALDTLEQRPDLDDRWKNGTKNKKRTKNLK